MKINKINSFGIILLLCCYAGNAQVIASLQNKVQIPTGFRKAKNNGIYVIAHRGAHNDIPENSIAAYQKAIDLGCDFVEIDVRTTKDGKFISMHNPTIDQYVTGLTGKVSEMTLAELRSLDIGSRVGPEWKGTRIPTFEEILQLCQGKIGIYLDLKDQKPEENLTDVDYSDLSNWAASPFKEDTSDSIPAFLKEEIRDQRADVFFIHPTSYFSKAENAPLNADLLDTIVNQTTDYRSILMQATVFNGSCRVFAPRYRQGNMEAFYIFETPEAKAAFNLAYNDVRKAFLYFLENYNGNRPIIIASHSQGSLHAIKLLQEFFDGTPLQKRLVCAYVVGYPIKKDAFKNILVGETARQTGCFVGWCSYAKGEIPKSALTENGNSVCVNPLTWTTSEQWASPELHQGVMNGFETIVPHTAGAGIEPASKILWVDGPIEENGEKVKNLHIYDYNLFWMNIRQNVKQRIDAYYKHAGNL